jgi:hypothetical protein
MTGDERKKILEQLPDKMIGKCACGHWSTLHTAETGYKDRPNRSSAQGHGYCAASRCTCPQFTWIGWVGKGERL